MEYNRYLSFIGRCNIQHNNADFCGLSDIRPFNIVEGKSFYVMKELQSHFEVIRILAWTQ